ncbi:MSHA biogenesis protein MshF [Shewanella sp. Isolate11]|uniref:MSHA biogenesis protein MshF n=1 Tax=Shewanella sp. Isolate11 TaxID=2908530 RepID=UPI001EFD71F1|nr:MSHA biogenesis protein MshF [Shewanella sp. Isolate11]MCG9695482.1 MSHA biogenesis protein MshF [Shewanella sp. Isolate11]
MQSQQQSDNHLLQVYGRLVALCVLLVILTVFGFRYFNAIEQTSAQNLRVEQSRLLNVLAMIRGQWLAQGRPQQMKLNWLLPENEQDTSILINELGWPTLAHVDENSCKILWQQLMGSDSRFEASIMAQGLGSDICLYSSRNGDQIRYKLSSGEVILLTYN